MVLFGNGDEIIILGGQENRKVHSDIHVFDLNSETITSARQNLHIEVLINEVSPSIQMQKGLVLVPAYR